MALGIIGIVVALAIFLYGLQKRIRTLPGSALRRYRSSDKRIECKRRLHISVCWCR